MLEDLRPLKEDSRGLEVALRCSKAHKGAAQKALRHFVPTVANEGASRLKASKDAEELLSNRGLPADPSPPQQMICCRPSVWHPQFSSARSV